MKLGFDISDIFQTRLVKSLASLTAAAALSEAAAAGRRVRIRGRVLRPDLDAVRLIVDVEDALLDLLVDLLGGVDERLLHVGGRLRRRLHEDEAVLARERLALLLLHLPPRLQVRLVADQHDHHVRVRMLTGVLQPRGQVVEGVAAGDVVDEQGARRAAVVRTGDRAECFLSSLDTKELDNY